MKKLILDEFFVLCICNNMFDYDLRLTNTKYTLKRFVYFETQTNLVYKYEIHTSVIFNELEFVFAKCFKSKY